MKRTILAVVFMALFGFILQPAQANAETNGIYVAPKFLMSFSNSIMGGDGADVLGIDHYSSFTLGGALAVGYDFHPQFNIPLRAEIEYAFRGWGGDDWDVSYYNGLVGADTTAKFTASTLMANFYLDFHNSTNFTPYIGAGIGLAFVYGDIDCDFYAEELSNGVSYGKSQTNLAWQVGAGVAYSFTENVAVDVAYRYVNMGYLDCSENGVDVDANIYAHEIMVGLRFTF